jgi:SAM-dependent methyltransferase
VGWQELFRRLPLARHDWPLRVLDVGCGNGRFALALSAQGASFDYLGVDHDEALLALARQHTVALNNGRAHFVCADLSEPAWMQNLPATPGSFDLIVCLAALHHLPGYELRLTLMRSLQCLLAPDGVLALSNWQFLSSPRFEQKQVSWAEVGLDDIAIEPGDALLPWNQGVHALRFVHQIDEEEMTRLARAAGLSVVASFYADGKEGNLNLYSLLKVDVGD